MRILLEGQGSREQYFLKSRLLIPAVILRNPVKNCLGGLGSRISHSCSGVTISGTPPGILSVWKYVESYIGIQTKFSLSIHYQFLPLMITIDRINDKASAAHHLLLWKAAATVAIHLVIALSPPRQTTPEEAINSQWSLCNNRGSNQQSRVTM